MSNAVIIGRRDDLRRQSAVCSQANVLRPEHFSTGTARGLAVCRYRSQGIPATARLAGSALVVDFDEPVPLLAPGQLLVLYDDADEEVLASGIIEP